MLLNVKLNVSAVLLQYVNEKYQITAWYAVHMKVTSYLIVSANFIICNEDHVNTSPQFYGNIS